MSNYNEAATLLLLATAVLMSSPARAKYAVSTADDISDVATIFESETLPTQEKFNPSVGNGHVATVLYSDTVFMNGLFNGELGESHRARIPSRINIRVDLPSTSILRSRYILNTEEGYFMSRLTTADHQIEQVTYAHRSKDPLLVTQITARFLQPTGSSSLVLPLADDPGPDSSDITFTPPETFSIPGALQQSGRTKTVEDVKYQPDPSPVYIIYSDVPDNVTLTEESPTVTYVMSVAETYDLAAEAFLFADGLVQSGNHSELLRLHSSAWRSIWASGNIILEGPNLELSKAVAGSMYYMLSSLPTQRGNAGRRRFYGLSPGGLANGALLKDYQGHSFWDTETWMFPPILVLWQETAKDLLLYRMNNIEPARHRAAANGHRGARFPWECAFTGVEVTPDCCPETRENQQHITADISFAARQFWAATGDTDWLLGENYSYPLDVNGCNFIREMAEFWVSRAELNSQTGQYEINGVMPPDEDHPYVNNSIYTNVVAAYSIFFAKHAECLCNLSMSGPVPEEWLNVARRLKFAYDPVNQFHPEFDGYEIGETIKQADVVLLGFPIMHITDPEKRKNDLEIYENVTRVDGPAMTWSMHAIGHLELGDDARAEALFNRSYLPYKVEPFKVWTEAQNQQGAVNFITGMGGFLQALLFGYAGLRLHLDHLRVDPKLPPGATNFVIQGMDYMGCSFTMAITADSVALTSSGDKCGDLTVATIAADSTLHRHDPREEIQLPRAPFVIAPKVPPACPLPEDTLGQNSSAAQKIVMATLYASVLLAAYIRGGI